jgi:hypothetical protein
MNVKHHLSPVRIAVCDQAVAAFGHAQVPGDGFCHAQNVPDQKLILSGEIVEGADVLLGDDEHMGGRGGVDVLECQADVVLEDDLCRDFPAYDVAKEAFVHRFDLPARWVPRHTVVGQTAGLAWIICLVILSVSCSSVSAPSSKDLQGTVERFHHDLRWKYYDAAAERVNPQDAQVFLEDVEDEKNELSISSWEIRKVELQKEGTEAKIRVQFKYYRMPSTVVKSEIVEQIWRKVKDEWFLFAQEKGPFVLTPAGGTKKDPGTPEDAPSP